MSKKKKRKIKKKNEKRVANRENSRKIKDLVNIITME